MVLPAVPAERESLHELPQTDLAHRAHDLRAADGGAGTVSTPSNHITRQTEQRDTEENFNISVRQEWTDVTDAYAFNGAALRRRQRWTRKGGKEARKGWFQ